MLKLLAAPHPTLRKTAAEVAEEEFGDELEAYMSQMATTMYGSHGIGLAAPQVNDSRRLIVMDPIASGNHLYKFVNPVITERSEEMVTSVERCLSVPYGEVKVDRHREVTVEWKAPDGTAMQETFTDFPATVIQHEIDHLNGITLVDRMSNIKRKMYLKKRQKRLGF